SSRRRHTRFSRDWSSDVCSSDLVDWAPAPLPRMTQEREVLPTEETFSGFVFKIQANMDPRHRDRIAFMRVCSGKYEQGMKMRHEIGRASCREREENSEADGTSRN